MAKSIAGLALKGQNKGPIKIKLFDIILQEKATTTLV
jgi:hypothetical protein